MASPKILRFNYLYYQASHLEDCLTDHYGFDFHFCFYHNMGCDQNPFPPPLIAISLIIGLSFSSSY